MFMLQKHVGCYDIQVILHNFPSHVAWKTIYVKVWLFAHAIADLSHSSERQWKCLEE
jgi:hypothetical protein